MEGHDAGTEGAMEAARRGSVLCVQSREEPTGQPGHPLLSYQRRACRRRQDQEEGHLHCQGVQEQDQGTNEVCREERNREDWWQGVEETASHQSKGVFQYTSSK